MPSCQDITKHSSDYLDHNLPWWKRLGFRVHLFMCLNCRRYLDQLKLTIATIGKIQTATPPVVEEQHVHDIIEFIQQQTNEEDWPSN